MRTETLDRLIRLGLRAAVAATAAALAARGTRATATAPGIPARDPIPLL